MIEKPDDDEFWYGELKESLLRNGIPIAEVAISVPKEIIGLTFPEEGRKVALDKLKMLSFSEMETNLPGVSLIEGVPLIRRIGANFEAWDMIEPILEDHAIKTGIPIEVSCPHGSDEEADFGEDLFSIRFYCACSHRGTEKYHEVFSFELDDGQDDGIKPSFLGVPIIDEKGRVVAEIVGTTLYILFDLVHSTGDHTGEILLKILDRYTAYKADPEKYLQEISAAYCPSYIEECSRRYALGIKELSEEIKEAEQNIKNYQRRIVESVRKRDVTKKHLDALISAGSESDQVLTDEFNNLRSLPGVELVIVGDGIVMVFTETIVVDYDSYSYELGKYRIDILTDQGDVRVFNLNREYEENDHPHISEGSCCFGNVSSGIAKFIGEYQYTVVIEIVMKFLRTVSSDSWYTSITDWPVVDWPTGVMCDDS
ncbi:MAG: hypothetical protein PHW52_01810 [Candidatus Pacebacteria bacterium]|nr:hypothetical protein [Candidatus Paceibacterota bacterium]